MYTLAELLSLSGLHIGENVGFLMDFMENHTDKSISEIENLLIEHIKQHKNKTEYLLTDNFSIELFKLLNIRNPRRAEINLQTIQETFYEFNIKVANLPNSRFCPIRNRDLSKYKDIYIPFSKETCYKYIRQKFITNLLQGVKYEKLAIDFLNNMLPDYKFRKASATDDTLYSVDIIAEKSGEDVFGVQIKSYQSVVNNEKYVKNLQHNKTYSKPVYYLYYDNKKFMQRKNGKYFVKVSEIEEADELIKLFV